MVDPTGNSPVGTMSDATEKHRAVALVAYVLILGLVHYAFVAPSLVPSDKAIWLYSGIASLLFGTLLLNPHFTPPSGAAANGFVIVITMLGAWPAVQHPSADAELVIWLGSFGAFLFLIAVVVLFARAPAGLETRRWVLILDLTARRLGTPAIFTSVIVGAVWLFHRDAPVQVFAILSTWTIIVALKPVEGVIAWATRARSFFDASVDSKVLGIVAAYQTPGVVLIRQIADNDVAPGTPLLVANETGTRSIAIAVNNVGRDEGVLLRALSFALPHNLEARIAGSAPIPNNTAVRLELEARDTHAIPDAHPASMLKRFEAFCGIVDEGTTLDALRFEVIFDGDLAEGQLIEASVGRSPVLFQIMEGVTREDIVQNKNKYGYVSAKARKIGNWNDQDRKFEPSTWLPQMNVPVFLKRTEEGPAIAEAIGRFPNTSYTVRLNISDAVTHNTAILGILGIGKSFLAIELVERMIAEGIKVICLDLTNQYANHLRDFIDEGYEAAKLAELRAVGGRGAIALDKDDGGTRKAFKEKMIEQITEFLSPENPRYLRIYNPSQFEVWRQVALPYKDKASRAMLTPCEITAVVSMAALEVMQHLGMTDSARVCLVYEEAHSLVPESNSVAAEGDKLATAASASAILQGRKYGLGCLLITQRTANVTKTILNQCNTVFAMRTFDDTGKTYLANYIGGEYASVLQSLPARHAVVFGKASMCENPVMIRLNDRPSFLAAFRAGRRPVNAVEPAPPAEGAR